MAIFRHEMLQSGGSLWEEGVVKYACAWMSVFASVTIHM